MPNLHLADAVLCSPFSLLINSIVLFSNRSIAIFEMAKRRGSPCFVILSALVLFTCIVLFGSKSLIPTIYSPKNICTDSCGKETAEKYESPKQNIWSDLDDDEFNDLLGFLYSSEGEVLNLTRVDKATA